MKPRAGTCFHKFTVPNNTNTKLSSEKNRKTVTDILNNPSLSDSYTRAADRLIELRSEKNVFKDLLKIYNEEKIVDSDIRKMTVFLLPFLFHDMPAITTNYDRVLERAYRLLNVEFDSVFAPDSDLADMVSQQNLHCLFKLHGDIGKETLNGKKLILSGKSYERVYFSSSSELVDTLKTFYKGKMMLFIGSSLKYDRTLEILEQVTDTGKVSHYAILPCSKEMLDDDSHFFGERGIRTIYYDPDHHESVKTVLEELMRGLDPDKFRIYKSINGGEKKSIKVDNPFVYNANIIGFYGRDKEMEELRRFVSAEGDLLWWVITGRGGAGKTRLVYELTKEMCKEGWNAVWICKDDLKDLSNLNKTLTIGRKNLVIADYGRSFAEELGRWMVGLARDIADGKNTSRNRILIIERTQDDIKDALLSALTEEDHNKRLKGKTWKDDFLCLNPLKIENIKEIIRNYGNYKDKLLNERIIENLLETLEKVDPGLRRPLYAMFIADAYCENEDPRYWDRDKVLDWVTDKEDSLLAKKINVYTGQKNVKQKKAFETVRFIATINGDISIDSIKDKYQDCWRKFESVFENTATGYDFEECINYVGIAEDGIIKSIRPDLLGEYFFLRHFEEYKDLLFLNDWTDNKGIMTLVLRCITDYGDQIKTLRAIFDMISKPESFPKRKMSIMRYASVVESFTFLLNDKDDLIKAIKLLESISVEYEESNILYMFGLLNLCVKLPLKEAVDTVCLIGELIKEDNRNKKFEALYADRLVYLIGEQPLKEAMESMHLLSELYMNNIESNNIALMYARGLALLSKKQTLEEAVESIRRLQELNERFGNDESIALRYARGLYYLCTKQPLKEAKESINLLKEINKRYEGNEEIARIYGEGLSSLSTKQTTKMAEKTVGLLEELSKKYDGNEMITIIYARALLNFSSRQSPEKLKERIPLFWKLCEKYEKNEKLAECYAFAINTLRIMRHKVSSEKKKYIKAPDGMNLKSGEIYATNNLNLGEQYSEKTQEEAIEYINSLEEIIKRFERNRGITKVYAGELVSICFNQIFKVAEESINKLKEVCIRYNWDSEFTMAYALGLVNFIIIQPVKDAEESVRLLRELTERFQDIEGINTIYRWGLANLCMRQSKQSPKEAKKSILLLRELAEKHQEDEQIAIVYAKALLTSLISKGILSQEEAKECTHILGKFIKRFKGNEVIAEAYARALVIIDDDQEHEELKKSMDLLKELSSNYKRNLLIDMAYAVGLLYMSFDQSPKEAMKRIRIIRKLSKRHEESDELIELYAAGLSLLIHKQSTEEVEKSLRLLRDIYENHKDNKIIVNAYRIGTDELIKKNDG